MGLGSRSDLLPHCSLNVQRNLDDHNHESPRRSSPSEDEDEDRGERGGGGDRPLVWSGSSGLHLGDPWKIDVNVGIALV